MQQEIDALKIAVLQGDEDTTSLAALNLLGATLLLFERAVVALEAIALNTQPGPR